MSEQEPLRPEPTARMRPELTYNSWILIVVTVAVVILLGLIVWYGRFPTSAPITRPTDRDTIHQLAGQWKAQWPQIPGTPEAFRARGLDALVSGDSDGAVAALTRALAVDPDSSDALLMLTVASLSGAEAGLSAEQREDIVAVVAELEPDHPLLPVAAAWSELSMSPAAALSLLGEPPDHPLGALARMRALAALDADAGPAAEAVLSSAPGHRRACEIAGRARLLSAQPAAALALLERCAAAGASGGVLSRLRGGALDGCGLFIEAAEAYQEAGSDSHAAAIYIQEGGATEAEIDALLEAGTPDVALHRLWWALLRDDLEAVAAADAALVTSGLEFEIARAAAALALGDAERTLSITEGLRAPQAHALRARALSALGDGVAAAASLDAALELIPWQVRLLLLEGEVTLHPVEVAAYSWSRHRDMPWPALVPTAELPAAGRELLEAQLEPLWSYSLGGSGELVEGVLAVQSELAAGRRDEALQGLVVLGEAFPEAAGIQRLMVEVRRR